MADSVGAVQIPTQVALLDESVGDPCLSRLCDFFAAVINARCATAWSTIAPNKKPVETNWTNDPEEVGFALQHLPALYLNRQAGKNHEWYAEDYDLLESVVQLTWIMPKVPVDRRRTRSNFMNGLVAVLIGAIETGQDPAYVYPDDPNPSAATLGSIIYQIAGKANPLDFDEQTKLWELSWTSSKQGVINIKTDGPSMPHFCMQATIKLVERRVIDVTAYDAWGTPALDLKVTTSDGQRLLAEGKV
jgi:hypothetical protein